MSTKHTRTDVHILCNYLRFFILHSLTVHISYIVFPSPDLVTFTGVMQSKAHKGSTYFRYFLSPDYLGMNTFHVEIIYVNFCRKTTYMLGLMRVATRWELGILH